MDDRRGRALEYAVLGLSVLVVPLAAVVVLEVAAVPGFDPGSVTGWGIVGGTLLAIAAVALPAVILSGWQSARQSTRDETTRGRRRS